MKALVAVLLILCTSCRLSEPSLKVMTSRICGTEHGQYYSVARNPSNDIVKIRYKVILLKHLDSTSAIKGMIIHKSEVQSVDPQSDYIMDLVSLDTVWNTDWVITELESNHGDHIIDTLYPCRGTNLTTQ